MSLSFKNRIARNYIIATAIVIAAVFLIIILIVRTTVFYNLDKNIAFEANKHRNELAFENDSIRFVNMLEWTEREHREVQVHPVFIQIVDESGGLMDKSPNLKDASLPFEKDKRFNEQFNTYIKGRPVRQIQLPIYKEGEIKGFILAAMSLEDASMVISNLNKVLLTLFPLVLLGLFGVARYLAGNSIKPIRKITATANHITQNNLNQRIALPKNKDELYTLTAAINELIQRMQETLERERQFTSDASHELRTPLAVLRGTFEVLNRKPRSVTEYKEKIVYGIEEINRMSTIVDQLLTLARFENTINTDKKSKIVPSEIIDNILSRYKEEIERKALTVNVVADKNYELISNPLFISLILDNLISNAIKYSRQQNPIDIIFSMQGERNMCTINDYGIGISKEDINQIYNPFFRSGSLQAKEVNGNGLGLPIVKKACDTLGIKIDFKSTLKEGTLVTLVFPDAVNEQILSKS